MIRAVEKVRERLVRTATALDKAGNSLRGHRWQCRRGLGVARG